MQIALALGGMFVYGLVFFPLYSLTKMGVVTGLSVIPVIVVAWLWGIQAGFLAGIFSFPLNTILLNLVGHQPGGWDVMINNANGLGTAILVLIGLVVGRLRDLGIKMRMEMNERRRSEEALRKSEVEFHRVATSISDFLWSAQVDVDGSFKYLYYSPVVEKITGRPNHFFLKDPQRWMGIIHPEDRARKEKMTKQFFSGQIDRVAPQ